MDLNEEKNLLGLVEKEGWVVVPRKPTHRNDTRWTVLVGEEAFVLNHPYSIHMAMYRRVTDSEEKLKHMIAVHHWLWPWMVDTWNEWDERRFRAHCEGWSNISLAGGAATGKSSCAARICCIFYLSNPRRNAVVVCSTTLDSLESRIWGYVQHFINKSAIGLPVKVLEGKPPKVLPVGRADKIHGMFAAAIRQGEDAKVISNLIGRHPDWGLMLVLDEATDMSGAIVQSFANLQKGVEFFQLWGIGNSKSRNDLHGALSTPAGARGWDGINMHSTWTWPTTHKNGVCLYFYPWDSPAIKEKDERKRELLAKFLPTTEGIEGDKRVFGERSESFYRFTLGFWKSADIDNTIVSESFLTEHAIHSGAEWSGFWPLEICAGLDPAFQYGGTGCVLRLAYYGHTTSELMVLDYRGEELLFRIEISTGSTKSPELQLAEQVVRILKRYNVPLYRLAIDCTGPGKAIAEVIRIVMGSSLQPIKVSFTANSKGIAPKKLDPATLTGRPTEFWWKLKEFIGARQIRGLDAKATAQLSSRLIIADPKKPNSQRLETKWEFRARMAAVNPKLAHSPDEADAAVLALFSAVMSFGMSVGLRKKAQK